MSAKTLFLTGSTGFLGQAVLKKILETDCYVIAPVRRKINISSANLELIDIENISDAQKVLTSVKQVHTIIHMAAKAHIPGVSLDEFKEVNTDATLDLAKSAVKSGVKRFIFISSIGVNGISNNYPFRSVDHPAPVEDYAVSKLHAELGLLEIASATNMEIVIIRPPLVYGFGAPGNFGKLISLTRNNFPLPFGSINNRRSFVAIDNLVDLIVTCVSHPKAANQTFLVSDDHDISTTELLTLLTQAAGKKPRLLPVPVSWLKAIGKITGKQAIIDRLCGNLQVDISHTKSTLGWTPPISVEEGIRRCFSDV